jgi:hypothetical protein
VTAEPRYEVSCSSLDGRELLVCLDCGVVVAIREAHTRFHSVLSSHAWSLAVLKTSHIGPAVHDRYDVVERIDSKKFGNWSADALAEVIAGMEDGP